MTIDERTCCFENRWPGPDERAVVNELLTHADSPHWAACHRYVARLVQIMAQKGYYASLSKEDVVQDSMVSIIKSLDDFRLDSKLTTWLASIVHRRMIDAARKRRATGEIVSLDTPDGSNEGDGERDVVAGRTTEEECLLREDLRETLTRLQDYVARHAKPERNSQVLNLVLLQGYSAADTAALLSIPVPTVNYVVRSARKYLFHEGRFPFRPSV